MISRVALRRCIRCGAKAVKPRTGPGRTTSYRMMPCLPIPNDLPIPTCGRCRSKYLDETTSSWLVTQLHAAFLDALRVRVQLATDILSQYISLRKLELLIGISQGYLSRLRAGVGNPSPELVAHLALLCHDPLSRLRELEQFWSLPPTEWPPLPSRMPRCDLSIRGSRTLAAGGLHEQPHQ